MGSGVTKIMNFVTNAFATFWTHYGFQYMCQIVVVVFPWWIFIVGKEISVDYDLIA